MKKRLVIGCLILVLIVGCAQQINLLCGNGICESGEIDTCPKDCQEEKTPVKKESVVQEINPNTNVPVKPNPEIATPEEYATLDQISAVYDTFKSKILSRETLVFEIPNQVCFSRNNIKIGDYNRYLKFSVKSDFCISGKFHLVFVNNDGELWIFKEGDETYFEQKKSNVVVKPEINQEQKGCTGDIKDIIEEGETRDYFANNGYSYEVKNLIVTDSGDIYAQFQVNGKITTKLKAGQLFVLPDNSILTIDNIIPSTTGRVTEDQVKFCLKTVNIEPEYSVKSSIVKTETIPANAGLEYYPNMYIEGDKFIGTIVVGDTAKADDVIAATDVAVSLQFKKVSPEIISDGTTEIVKIDVSATQLASKISNPRKQDIISVGRSCDNEVSNNLLGYPATCAKDLKPGTAMIILSNFYNKYQIVIYGYDIKDTRNAANVLANWKNYGLKGKEICIKGTKIVPCIEILSIEPCTDSDGGKDYYIKGVSKGIYSGTSGDGSGLIYGEDGNPLNVKFSTDPFTIYYDHCATDIQLNEAYCDTNGKLSSSPYQCPNGCQDGVCLQTPIVETPCTDSDGGKDYYKKGSTKGVNEIGQETQGTDNCVLYDTTEYKKGQLVEKYCDGKIMRIVAYDCPFGCLDGVCKEATAIPNVLPTQVIQKDGVFYINQEMITYKGADRLWDYSGNLESSPELKIKYPNGETSVRSLLNDGNTAYATATYQGTIFKITNASSANSNDFDIYVQILTQDEYNAITGSAILDINHNISVLGPMTTFILIISLFYVTNYLLNRRI